MAKDDNIVQPESQLGPKVWQKTHPSDNFAPLERLEAEVFANDSLGVRADLETAVPERA